MEEEGISMIRVCYICVKISKNSKIVVFIYFLIMLFTCYMLKLEGSKLNLKKDMKIKAVLFNPFFLMTYVLCALKALFTKEIMWDKIEHKENKITR